MRIMQMIFIVMMMLIGTACCAKNLGVFGEIYPIDEEDFLVFIERKVGVLQKTGELDVIQNKIKKRVSDHIDRPVPVTAITRTMKSRAWNYDPSVMVPYDLQDINGHVFARAGTKINPLKMVNLHTALAFYDADDKDQVEWAKKINKRHSGKIKFVLINGSISSQEKILHQPIYFDQRGRLTSKFHIEHVPALVYQEGYYLKISEILL